MGMRDESWCQQCGTSLPYAEHDVTCGDCVGEGFENFVTSFINYLNKQVAELEQHFEDAKNNVPIGEHEFYESDDWYEGSIETTKNILLELESRFRNE